MTNAKAFPCIRILIRGHVQGVGFRAYTQRLANQLGIQGWVRNLPSGDVDCYACHDTALDLFIDTLKSGPTPGHVEAISATPTENLNPIAFQILPTPPPEL